MAIAPVAQRSAKRRRAREVFPYDQLAPEHIRILQVTCQPKRNGRPCFSTRLRSFHVQRLPHFIALSYAWPLPGSPTRPLHCNHRHLAVSRHVYTALENFCPFNEAVSFAVWIDAICIDQNNETEKSEQVPHMGSIYGFASQVLVWLGPNELVDLHREQIERLAQYVKHVPEAQWDSVILRSPFPKRDHEIWKALESMLWFRWFKRLWIVQELCLGREVNVLCGHCFVPWRSLAVIFQWQYRVRDTDQFATEEFREQHAFGQALNDCKEIFKAYRDLDDTVTVDIAELLVTLKTLRSQSCSKAIDKVFGLMFLLPRTIRVKIMVDYSQEDEYWRTYVDLARAMLVQPRGLCVLSWAPSMDRVPELPSWCPDWNLLPTGFPYPLSLTLEEAGRLVRSSAAPPARFGDDPRYLQLRGFQIDRIAYTNSQKQTEDDGSLSDILPVRTWLGWQNQCLSALQNRFRTEKDPSTVSRLHLRNLTLGIWKPDWGSDVEKRKIIETDWPLITKCYDGLISHCENVLNSDYPYPTGEYGLYPIEDYATLFHESMINPITAEHSFSYFISEQGRVGRGSSAERAGDILVILNTAPIPFILRPDEESNVAVLIGEAYLDGCMDLQAMPTEGRHPDQWFTLG